MNSAIQRPPSVSWLAVSTNTNSKSVVSRTSVKNSPLPTRKLKPWVFETSFVNINLIAKLLSGSQSWREARPSFVHWIRPVPSRRRTSHCHQGRRNRSYSVSTRVHWTVFRVNPYELLKPKDESDFLVFNSIEDESRSLIYYFWM